MKPFPITEEWMSSLWLPAAAAALLFAAAFFFMLPLAAPAAPKAAFSLVLGAVSALALLFRQKREHLRRHEAEAAFLGFSCSVKGSLWNPFAGPALLLHKAAGDPEEDRLLADLVRISGPDYVFKEARFYGAGDWPAICAAALAVLLGAFHGLLPLLLPLFSLAAMLILVPAAGIALAKAERRACYGEASVPASGEGGYRQWNFLFLESKRERTGRLARMEAEIKRVLMEEAGLAAGAAVLEVGAGGGFLWKHLPEELRPGWTQAEKDPASALYAERHGYGARFCRSDVKALPFGGGAFDAVVGLECFDSLTPEDFSGFLLEAMRTLKPGGRLVHLKDFRDWPGQRLAQTFNVFAMKALRVEPVSFDDDLNLGFMELSAAAAAGLKAAAGKEPGPGRVYAEVLAEIYAAGPGSDPRFAVPMYVSAMALKKAFIAAGFEVVADCLGPGNARGAMAYIVARKPA